MGFMDEVSAFTKGVGQKAKGNYDVVAMNARISSFQKEIHSTYFQMGEKYYISHKENPDEDMKSFIEKLISLEAQILNTKQEIEDTKGATASIPLRAATTSEDVAASGEHGFCASCGAPLLADSLFCVECGATIELKNKGEDYQ